MAQKGKSNNPAESFSELVKEFGDAVGKIFDDPELKEKAKEFGDSAVKSAKQFGSRFKDEEVKEKFKGVGKAAKDFGNSVSDYFSDSDKQEEESGNKKKDDWEKKIEDKMEEFSRNAEKAGKEFGEKVDKAGKEFGQKMEKAGKKVDTYFKETRGGRITGYAFSIFFGTLFLVFLYYYNHYIAFYDNVDGTWMRYPLLTGDFDRWLPIVVTALLASIIGNIILIIFDGYFFRRVILMVMDMFALASTIALLIIFPFDFSVMPGNDLSGILNPIVTVVLILICVGIGIAILVRFVKMIIGMVKKAD
jgi:hypothetical protein